MANSILVKQLKKFHVEEQDTNMIVSFIKIFHFTEQSENIT